MPLDIKGSTITFSTCRPGAEPGNANYRRLIPPYSWQVFLRRPAISLRGGNRNGRYGNSRKVSSGASIGDGPSTAARPSAMGGSQGRDFFHSDGIRAIAKL